MKVTRYGPDWLTILNVSRMTQRKKPVTKEPSEEWKRKLIRSRHSPLRMIQFLIESEAQGFVVNHITRHTYQAPQPYVATSRTDTLGTSERPPDTETKPYALYLNADALIEMAEYRLCYKASKETREQTLNILMEVYKSEPLLVEYCEPSCVKHGRCNEFKPCGYMNTPEYKLFRTEWLEG